MELAVDLHDRQLSIPPFLHGNNTTAHTVEHLIYVLWKHVPFSSFGPSASLVRRVGITVTYYFGCLLGSGRQAFGVELGQERVQVAAGESPLERRSRLLVMALESQEALFEFDQRGEVIWCEDFSLNDGEIDLNLIEPTGVYRCVDKDYVGPLRLHPINGLLTSMS